MCGSQAALVVANARRHWKWRVRNDLGTLINAPPVGVVVFDAATGPAMSFNREARGIMDGCWLEIWPESSAD